MRETSATVPVSDTEIMEAAKGKWWWSMEVDYPYASTFSAHALSCCVCVSEVLQIMTFHMQHWWCYVMQTLERANGVLEKMLLFWQRRGELNANGHTYKYSIVLPEWVVYELCARHTHARVCDCWFGPSMPLPVAVAHLFHSLDIWHFTSV